jgi:hypothetical protein
MKTLKTILALVTFVFVFTSCEDDAVKAILKSDVAPNELKAPSSEAYVLTLADKANTLETFQWTAPDFGFPAAASYTLQIDAAGNNFADAIAVVTTDLQEAAVNVGAFNDFLLGLGLAPEEAADIDLRVMATVSDKVGAVYSNTRTITVTPYATTFPPIYGMGPGLKGWGPWPGNAVEWQSSEFKKYETVAYFTNGQPFRWFAQLDWGPTSYNYPFFTSVDPVFGAANDGDSNLKVAGPSGWYKVDVDLAAKTVTAEAVSEPELYMVGPAVGDWNQALAVKMMYIKPGVFEVTTDFTTGPFRFFGQHDWNPTSYNYPFFTSVDANFENANDDDLNLQYVGTPGPQKITVDLNNKTVTLGELPDPELFMTGAALNGWNWDEGVYITLTYVSDNQFEATADFTSGETFRFFGQTDWGPTSYNYPYFTTVDTEFVNAADGDSNFRYTGTSGSRTIHVNMTTKEVTLE